MIDVLHRDKDIPKEVLFLALEESLAQGVRKRLGAGEELIVKIDRQSGELVIEDDEEEYELDMDQLGRIVAQSVKQGLQQRIREAERDILFDDYETRVGSLANGVVQRFEGDFLVVNLGRTEAYLSRDDRVRGETFTPGDRIRALVVEVSKEGSRIRILLSRTHPDLVRRLFALEVPEIADGVIEIKRVVREPGYRTKMAVVSQDPKIDCIGACVGVRGSRIKAVIDELRGERVDIIRWSDSLETLILNGLKPATIHLDNIYPDVDRRAAVVLVDEDQQSLAIGKRGQNVRLASRLCGWDLDIKTRAELEGSDEAEADGEDTPESGTADAPAAEAPDAADTVAEDTVAADTGAAQTASASAQADAQSPGTNSPEATADH
ncbi:MAG: transcription termination factor NusA [Planctomycetota bacterium]|jgi:N utilization substance protein A|nr:transcription termination factor NusA [Planctomycetota bacterium]MDP6956107.1 transcription termination factor NusA [Planctomycetota bacterium]